MLFYNKNAFAWFLFIFIFCLQERIKLMFIKWYKIPKIYLLKHKLYLLGYNTQRTIKSPRILNSKRLVSPQMITLKIGQGVPDNFRMEKDDIFPYCLSVSVPVIFFRLKCNMSITKSWIFFHCIDCISVTSVCILK